MIWVDTIVQGILLGGLYALFAAGLSLVFGIMRLVNLAHGDMIIFAAFTILLITGTLRSQRIPAGPLESASVNLGIVTVGWMPLLTFTTAVAVIIGLNQLFYRTALGRAFRATSDDPVTASLMGIAPKSIFAIATGLAMVVVTIAALYLGMRANFDPSIGPARLIYAFEAVIIGGLGSLWGTLAGGIIMGVAQTMGAAINPEWQILSGHIAFLIVLLIRPRGLFPHAVD